MVTNDELLKSLHLEQESKPFYLTNLFVDQPCKVLSIAYIILVIVTAIVFPLGYFEYSTFGQRDYLIWSDPIV